MKHRLLWCAILIAFSTSAKAQSIGFGVQGDIVNFNFAGDLKEVYSLGYGGGAHLDFHLGFLGLRLSGDYLLLTPDAAKLAQITGSVPGVTIDGLKITAISGNLNLKVPVIPLPVVSIYATGGGGVVYLKATDATVFYQGAKVTTVPAPDPQTKAALNAGAGADFKLGGVTLFAELKVNWILTEGETSTMVPLGTLGITF
jgi:opacity protein-like surface antigen